MELTAGFRRGANFISSLNGNRGTTYAVMSWEMLRKILLAAALHVGYCF